MAAPATDRVTTAIGLANVTVFTFDLAKLTDDVERQIAGAIAPARRERAARYRFADDRRRSHVAGALIRRALARSGEDPAGEHRLSAGEHGKPFLPGAALHFNVSHAGDRVVCAVSAQNLGVDVEAVMWPGLDLRKIFSPDERDYVEGGDIVERARRFTRVWTLKESYIKYLGVGLGLPLRDFSVVHGEQLAVIDGAGDSSPSMHVRDWGQYVLALCHNQRDAVCIESATAAELLEFC
ncbi:4'-phosphopantetheinyl transferase superfamily protein [Microbacterium sp.]|uniref:4'-phosphopantetheinyl transferase family protein n=1 Tax=Microbacterium sp. TaxID=51671 RepID=UPI0026058181|nr:4'-phosphopantetheinyl transferase superfamily protein [Microbacterium sp.]